MKLGVVLVVYLCFGIWVSTNRIGNVMLIIGGMFVISGLLAIIGWLLRSAGLASFGVQGMKWAVVVAGFGIFAMMTWTPLLKLIFK